MIYLSNIDSIDVWTTKNSIFSNLSIVLFGTMLISKHMVDEANGKTGELEDALLIMNHPPPTNTGISQENAF